MELEEKLKITGISLENFRGISKMEEEMKFKKFNVFVGKNNSGKTTILQSLFLFPHPLRAWIKNIPVMNWIKTLLSRKQAFIYKYFGIAKIEYKIGNEKLIIELDNELNFKINGKLNLSWNKIVEFNEIPQKLKKLTSGDIQNISIYIPSEFSTFYKEYLKDYVLKNEDSIVKKGIHSKIAKEISGVVNDKYTELIWKGNDIVARIEGDPPYYVSLDDLGSGIKKAVSVMLATENIDPHLVLWDDFATNFHPLLIKMLLKWLNEKDWQVFITTHSIDVLYYLIDEDVGINEEECNIILLNRDKEDVLHFEYKTLSDIDDMINSGLDPRKIAEVIGI